MFSAAVVKHDEVIHISTCLRDVVKTRKIIKTVSTYSVILNPGKLVLTNGKNSYFLTVKFYYMYSLRLIFCNTAANMGYSALIKCAKGFFGADRLGPDFRIGSLISERGVSRLKIL